MNVDFSLAALGSLPEMAVLYCQPDWIWNHLGDRLLRWLSVWPDRLIWS